MSAASAPATSDIPVIAGLSEIAGRYDAILCDVWGVLIDGRRHFPDAAAALRQVHPELLQAGASPRLNTEEVERFRSCQPERFR